MAKKSRNKTRSKRLKSKKTDTSKRLSKKAKRSKLVLKTFLYSCILPLAATIFLITEYHAAPGRYLGLIISAWLVFTLPTTLSTYIGTKIIKKHDKLVFIIPIIAILLTFICLLISWNIVWGCEAWLS